MASECAIDLKEHNITCLTLWPGPVRTEGILKVMEGDGLDFEGHTAKMVIILTTKLKEDKTI